MSYINKRGEGMKIVFVTNNTKKYWWGYENDKLGGAWYAYLCLAKELVKLGHDVYCFHNTPEKQSKFKDVDGLKVGHRDNLKGFLENNEIDVFIGERDMPIIRSKYNIKKVFYHSHNTGQAEHPGDLLTWVQNGSVDQVIFVSKWHSDVAKKFPDDKKYIIPNGTYLYPVKGEKKKNRIVWASNPTRGLSVLANEIFPRVQKLIPDIELHVAGGFDIYNNKPNEAKGKDNKSYSVLYENGDVNGSLKKNIVRYGSLTQSELGQFMHEGTLLVYPLTNRSETGSIVCVQAMANLTPVITYDKCVMSELIRDRGVLIPEKNTTYDDWADTIKSVLMQESIKEGYYYYFQRACDNWRNNYLWQTIALQFDHDLKEMIK
jgi:glycosyltransferase involved in cell wall biosynthesis